jgi:hypothetical protein
LLTLISAETSSAAHPQEALYAGVLIVITLVTVNVLGERFATRWEAPGR